MGVAFKEKVKAVRGVWTILEHARRDRKGRWCRPRLISKETKDNLVTASGRGLLWDIVMEVQATLAAVAIGSSAAAVQDSDTVLGTEVSRWQLTSMSRSDSTMTVRLFLGTTQANGFTYREAGIFNRYPSGGGDAEPDHPRRQGQDQLQDTDLSDHADAERKLRT